MSVGSIAYAPWGFSASGLLTRSSRRRCGGLDPPACRRLRLVIEGTVAQVFGVANAELFRATRGKARVALARQVAMYLAHVSCGLSFTEVGLVFGRDRTTVAYACGLIEDRRDDPLFDRTLELLEWAVPSLIAPHRAAPALFA